MKLPLPRFAAPLVAAFTLIATACSGDSGAQSPTATGLPARPDLSVIVVARDHEVGESRLPFVVQRSADQTRIENRAGDLSITYGLTNENGVVEGTVKPLDDVTWTPWPTIAGVYVTHPEFSQAGVWTLTVSLRDGDRTLTGSASVQVVEDSTVPAVGDMAPEVPSKTAGTVQEARQISSDTDPNPELYSISLGEAVRSGKPVVALFSTPAFCSTQTCGPQLEVIEALQAQHGDAAHFVHVEIWDNPREMLDTGNANLGRVSPAVEAWGLQTEPWTFLVDADGRIAARFEAFTTEAELNEAIEAMLSA